MSCSVCLGQGVCPAECDGPVGVWCRSCGDHLTDQNWDVPDAGEFGSTDCYACDGLHVQCGTCGMWALTADGTEATCGHEAPKPWRVLLKNDAPRDEWLAERDHGIGSSDAPIILQLSSWSSRVKLYAQKIGQMGGMKDSEKLQMGRRMEPIILELLAEALEGAGHTVESPALAGELIANRKTPWLRATLDAWAVIDGKSVMVELKNSDRWEQWDDGPPPAYWCQCQHQMAVTEQPRMLLAVLVRGWMLRWVWVERDEEYMRGTHMPALRAFWNCIKFQDLPPIDASADTRAALAKIYPQSTKGAEVALGGEWIDLDRELVELQGIAAAATERADEIKNRLRSEIGEAEAARIPSGVLWTWKGKNGRRALRRYETND